MNHHGLSVGYGAYLVGHTVAGALDGRVGFVLVGEHLFGAVEAGKGGITGKDFILVLGKLGLRLVQIALVV